jgi:predicted ATPase
LLVLDNFEHLLDGLDVLVTMLQSTPAIKMLVTSREALNLREDWLYPARPIASDGTGYLQAIDSDGLLRACQKHDLVLLMRGA